MPSEPPFDVFDGEGLEPATAAGDSVEEGAMHVDPESLPLADLDPAWSQLTEVVEADDATGPVQYFEDEQPETLKLWPEVEEAREEETPLNLEDLMERQHYSFRQKG